MQRPPRHPDAAILTPALSLRVLLVGGLILAGAFGLYEWGLAAGAGIAQARTLAVTAVVMIEIFYLLNCRSLDQSIFRIGPFSNPWVLAGIPGLLALQAMFVHLPVMNRVFQSAPLGVREWGLTAAAGVITYGIVEIEKSVRRRRRGEV